MGGCSFERRVVICRASPPGSSRDMYKKAVETGISVHRGPVGEHGGGAPLLGTLKETLYIYIAL